MPNINIVIPDVDQSISRPVMYAIIEQVKSITGIRKDSKVFYPGDSEKMKTPGSNIDSKNKSSVFNSEDRTYIETTEEYDVEALSYTTVAKSNNVPIFIDKKLGINITPIYAMVDAVIEFKHKTPSKNTALKWRDDMRVKASNLRDVNSHIVSYHYLIPTKMLEVLNDIYKTKELTEGDGNTFREYLNTNFTDRLTDINSISGGSTELGISESQGYINGIYDFSGLPEKPTRESDGTWIINFSYKFSYNKPISCNMKYPVMVHNNLLDRAYTEFVEHSYVNYKDMSYRGVFTSGLKEFESKSYLNKILDKPIIRLPIFDDFSIPQVEPGTGTVIIALCQVENNTLINLNELGDIALNEDVIKFIKESEYKYICNPYQSIINVSLYRNSYLTSAGTLTCNSDLDIFGTETLDLKNQHRVRISLVVDLTSLDPKAMLRLRKYPKAMVSIIGSLNDLLRNHPDFNDLGDLKYISSKHFDFIYTTLTGLSYGTGTGFGVSNFERFRSRVGFLNLTEEDMKKHRNYRGSMKTVQLSSIITSPRK